MARTETPSAKEHAREAAAEWGLALRYAAAATKPVVGRAAEVVKERAVRRLADGQSLKDRLNPGKTEKGGRVGEAADSLLGKLGTPGKLAAKASLGSRLVERLGPSGPDGDASDEETEEAADETADAPEADEPEPEDGPEADEPEEGPEADEPDDQPEAEAEPADDEPDGDRDDTAENGSRSGDWTEHPHAYSEDLEQYEHEEAYETTST